MYFGCQICLMKDIEYVGFVSATDNDTTICGVSLSQISFVIIFFMQYFVCVTFIAAVVAPFVHLFE